MSELRASSYSPHEQYWRTRNLLQRCTTIAYKTQSWPSELIIEEADRPLIDYLRYELLAAGLYAHSQTSIKLRFDIDESEHTESVTTLYFWPIACTEIVTTCETKRDEFHDLEYQIDGAKVLVIKSPALELMAKL